MRRSSLNLLGKCKKRVFAKVCACDLLGISGQKWVFAKFALRLYVTSQPSLRHLSQTWTHQVTAVQSNVPIDVLADAIVHEHAHDLCRLPRQR